MTGIPALILLALMLATLAGLIALQIYLSRREGVWPGLILPILSLLISILMVLYMAVPTDATVWEAVSAVGGTFLVGNIPTVIYLLIYFACRETQKRRRLLEKMNIQDLGG